MTLAAWGLVTLRLHAAGLAAEVYVADSTIRYRKPLYADLVAEARLRDAADWDGFVAALRSRGRAGIALTAQVPLPEGGVAATFEARFAAIVSG
jgi:thioesterase domain-containing protein